MVKRRGVESDTTGPVGWLTRAEAAATLRCSEKTVNRYADGGKIQRTYRRVAGRRPLPVFHPGDVERIKKETVDVRPFAVPPAVDTPTLLPALLPRQESPALTAIAALMAAVKAPQEKLFLSVDEAAQYTGLSRGYLLELLRRNKIPAMRRRGWRIWRDGLKAALSRLVQQKSGPAS